MSFDQNRSTYSVTRLLGVATMVFCTSRVDVADLIRIPRSKGFGGISPYLHGVMNGWIYFDDLQEVFGIVVDNIDAGFSTSSNWILSTGSMVKYGVYYRHNQHGSAHKRRKMELSFNEVYELLSK